MWFNRFMDYKPPETRTAQDDRMQTVTFLHKLSRAIVAGEGTLTFGPEENAILLGMKEAPEAVRLDPEVMADHLKDMAESVEKTLPTKVAEQAYRESLS